MKTRNLLLAILFLFTAFPALSQLSDLHYLPPVYTNGRLDAASLYVSTPSVANVRIRVFEGDDNVPVFDGNINAANPYIQDEPIAATGLGNNTDLLIMNSIVNQVIDNDRGVRVEATAPVYAALRVRGDNEPVGFGVISSPATGIITSKGREALGRRFRIGSSPIHIGNASAPYFTGSNNQATGSNMSFYVSVMATQDNTTITFSQHNPNMRVIRNVTNIAFQNTYNLDAGEVVTIGGRASASPNNEDGLIGALLTSNRDIVVNSGTATGAVPTDRNTANQLSDFMADQLVPEENIGYEYLFARGRGNNVSEQVLVVATQNNTPIHLNGANAPAFTLNAGYFRFIENE